jgi:inhibitor of KinA
MESSSPILKRVSDHSLLVSFGEEVSPALHHDLLRFTNLLLSENNPFVRNVHPAYTTVLVSFDPLQATFTRTEQYVHSALQKVKTLPLPATREIRVPVLYGGDFGPGLVDVASHNQLSPDDVIEIHSSGEYLVCFLGFSPGFPYLAGMSGRIATPRLATPRTKTPAGSVAIGGRQTGIYPMNSPGGWRIIGRTPLRLFRPNENPPTFLQMGDIVRFDPISIAEFERLC